MPYDAQTFASQADETAHRLNDAVQTEARRLRRLGLPEAQVQETLTLACEFLIEHLEG